MADETETIRALDIFCGAGGSSTGARMAGANVVGGIDLWSTAIETFQLNFPNAKTWK
jgi:DNA (cytosine-5)-methyltransferase 1